MFTKRWLIDAFERVVATFAQAFLAIIVAAPILDMSTWKAAAVSGIAAAMSVLKALIAKGTGDPESASLASSVPGGP